MVTQTSKETRVAVSCTVCARRRRRGAVAEFSKNAAYDIHSYLTRHGKH